MKIWKKGLAVVLAATSALGFFACNKKKEENRSDTLYAVVTNKGYGTVWTEALLSEFCKLNPQYKYDIEVVYNDDQIITGIQSGKGYCRWDLAFNGAIQPAESKYLLDLTEVYNSKIEGGTRDGTTVVSNMDKTILDALKETQADGDHYFAMPWTAEVGGLCVNVSKMNSTLGEDWRTKYPCRTTDELKDLAEACKQKGVPTFMYAADNDSYPLMLNAWFAQYNGAKGIDDYFNGRYDSPDGVKVGAAVAKNKGTLLALETLQALLSPDGYAYSNGDAIEWGSAQTRFMTGESVAYAIGDWIQLEMSKQFPDTEVEFIRTPVISALATEKLGITDEQLCKVIDYVDGKTTTAPTISSAKYTAEEIIDTVYEARRWVYSFAEYFTVVVPEYSAKTEVAKQFLKWMVSDEGQKVYIKATKGLTMAYGYDLEEDQELYGSLSGFAKSRWDIANNCAFYLQTRQEKYGKVGLAPFRAIELAPISTMLARRENRKTAKELYDYDYKKWSDGWEALEAKLGN